MGELMMVLMAALIAGGLGYGFDTDIPVVTEPSAVVQKGSGLEEDVPAEGELVVTQKSVVQFEGEDSAYFYAKVENQSDEPVGVGDGKLVAFASDGDVLLSSDYVMASPAFITLQPGEYAYVYDFEWKDALQYKQIGDYQISMETSDYAMEYGKLPCETSIELNSDYDNYVSMTFTNTTSDILYDLHFIVALYDTEGNLLYVGTDFSGSVGIHPDSKVTVKEHIDSSLLEYYEEQGIEIGSVDGIMYYGLN